MSPHALIPSATPLGLENVKLLRRNSDANALFAHLGDDGLTPRLSGGTRRQVARDLLGRLSGPQRPVELLQKPANGRNGLVDRKRSDRQGRES